MKQKLILNIGKIKANKIKTLIGEIEFKGQTKTELNAYLDYITGEYKESKKDLTELFGDIDQEVLNFLNLVCSIEINDTNFNSNLS